MQDCTCRPQQAAGLGGGLSNSCLGHTSAPHAQCGCWLQEEAAAAQFTTCDVERCGLFLSVIAQSVCDLSNGLWAAAVEGSCGNLQTASCQVCCWAVGACCGQAGKRESVPVVATGRMVQGSGKWWCLACRKCWHWCHAGLSWLFQVCSTGAFEGVLSRTVAQPPQGIACAHLGSRPLHHYCYWESRIESRISCKDIPGGMPGYALLSGHSRRPAAVLLSASCLKLSGSTHLRVLNEGNMSLRQLSHTLQRLGNLKTCSYSQETDFRACGWLPR